MKVDHSLGYDLIFLVTNLFLAPQQPIVLFVADKSRSSEPIAVGLLRRSIPTKPGQGVLHNITHWWRDISFVLSITG